MGYLNFNYRLKLYKKRQICLDTSSMVIVKERDHRIKLRQKATQWTSSSTTKSQININEANQSSDLMLLNAIVRWHHRSPDVTQINLTHHIKAILCQQTNQTRWEANYNSNFRLLCSSLTLCEATKTVLNRC